MLRVLVHTARSFHAPSAVFHHLYFQDKDKKSETFQSDMTKWSRKSFFNSQEDY